MTYKFKSTIQTYLRVDIGNAGPLFAVEAQINFRVAEEFFPDKRLVVSGALVSSCCFLLNFEKKFSLFQTYSFQLNSNGWTYLELWAFSAFG